MECETCGAIARRQRLFQFYFLLVVFCISFVVGCQTQDKNTQLFDQIEQLEVQNTQLQSQIEQSESKIAQLQEQIEVLSGLPDNLKGENLYRLQRVNIHRYTNIIIDDDEDGRKESLVVYIQPIDENGDKIKASGSVDVQLWNLNKPDGQALLGQWRVEPDELRELWVAFVVINYRLTFDVSEIIDNFNEPLTVKVKFTDYLSGRVFEGQKVIEPSS